MSRITVAFAMAALGVIGVAAVAPSLAKRQAVYNFDPLYVNGALFGSAQGQPPVLRQLMLAQAEPPPFKPGHHLPARNPRELPPLYKDLGNLHLQVSTTNPRAQAF